MKRSITYGWVAALFFALVAAPFSTSAADDNVDEWTVDGDRSTVRFISDAPAERIVGTSEEVEGAIQWNRATPTSSTGRILFPVDSMRTGNRTRDRHLTESSWLNASENPNVIFELQELGGLRVAESDNRLDYQGTARGTVELNGVQNSQEAQVEIAILPERKLARIEFELSFRLADHEVEGADNMVGREVGETIDVTGLVYANWE